MGEQCPLGDRHGKRLSFDCGNVHHGTKLVEGHRVGNHLQRMVQMSYRRRDTSNAGLADRLSKRQGLAGVSSIWLFRPGSDSISVDHFWAGTLHCLLVKDRRTPKIDRPTEYGDANGSSELLRRSKHQAVGCLVSVGQSRCRGGAVSNDLNETGSAFLLKVDVRH
jgi:hypothetical protein